MPDGHLGAETVGQNRVTDGVHRSVAHPPITAPERQLGELLTQWTGELLRLGKLGSKITQGFKNDGLLAYVGTAGLPRDFDEDLNAIGNPWRSHTKFRPQMLSRRDGGGEGT